MSSKISASLERELISAIGETHLVSDGDELDYYGRDRCQGGWPVTPLAIAFPADRQQVQEIVRACARHATAIVPSGGRTGLAGGATASQGELVLSLQRMKAIDEVDRAARTVRCEAGATVEALQAKAAAVDLLYPVDFAAKGTAHVAGSIATNAGGVRVVRYGSTRAWVHGLSVVLASGELLELGGKLVKDNSGYDLKQAFIGSEGTLGVIVDATMRLCRPPRDRRAALCGVQNLEAVLALFRRVRDTGLVCSAFECFDQGCLEAVLAHRDTPRGPLEERSPHHALIEVEIGDGAEASVVDELFETVLGDAMEAEEVDDAVLAQTPAQWRELWAWREDISEALHSHRPHKADISLPLAEIPAFVELWQAATARSIPGSRPLVFGHVGDGNLHLNLVPPPGLASADFWEQAHRLDDEVYRLVGERSGSISAEHGVGLLKREALPHCRTPAEIDAMRSIKRALDPKGLLNPDKIFV